MYCVPVPVSLDPRAPLCSFLFCTVYKRQKLHGEWSLGMRLSTSSSLIPRLHSPVLHVVRFPRLLICDVIAVTFPTSMHAGGAREQLKDHRDAEGGDRETAEGAGEREAAGLEQQTAPSAEYPRPCSVACRTCPGPRPRAGAHPMCLSYPLSRLCKYRNTLMPVPVFYFHSSAVKDCSLCTRSLCPTIRAVCLINKQTNY